MDGSPVPPPVLACAPHSMEEADEPSHLFLGYSFHQPQNPVESGKINAYQ
jgi:hypothetical protein